MDRKPIKPSFSWRCRDLPIRGIRAFVISVGFPETIDELAGWILDRLDEGDTDGNWPRLFVDSILNNAADEGTTNWSIPTWAEPGDVAFFYQTARSLRTARQLLREARGGDRMLRRCCAFLADSVAAFEHFSGRVFALGRVMGDRWRSDGQTESYWGDRTYADVGYLTRIRPAVPIDAFRHVFSIRRRATTTPLDVRQFDEFRRILESRSPVPSWLSLLSCGHPSFAASDGRSWRDIAADPDIRFLTEQELRGHFIDPLLGELCGRRSLDIECQCWRGRRPAGIADYMIALGDEVIPVEAKLKASSSDTLSRQLASYLGIDSFRPLSGERVTCLPTRRCLLIDQNGLSMFADGGFVNGVPAQPWISRRELCSRPPDFIADHIRKSGSDPR